MSLGPPDPGNDNDWFRGEGRLLKSGEKVMPGVLSTEETCHQHRQLRSPAFKEFASGWEKKGEELFPIVVVAVQWP